MTEADDDEKTDADRKVGRQQVDEEWGQDDRTDVDAKPPVDAPTELAKPR